MKPTLGACRNYRFHAICQQTSLSHSPAVSLIASQLMFRGKVGGRADSLAGHFSSSPRSRKARISAF